MRQPEFTRFEGEQADVARVSPPAAAARVRESAAARAIAAAYYAFVLWIPIETLVVFDATKNGDNKEGITVSKILGMLLFGLAVIEWRRCFRRLPAAFWMLVWYFIVFALSELWIPKFLSGKFLASELTLLQMIALFIISVNLFAEADLRTRVLRLYGWWISIVALSMILGIFGHQYADLEGRMSLLGEDPNFAASLYALGAVCIAGNKRLFESKGFGFRALLSLAGIVILILGILQTGSRGGFLAFIAGILGLAVCGGRRGRMKRALVAGAVIALLSGFVFVEFQRGSTTAARLQKAWTEGDTTGRTGIYGVAWEMFQERPLLGYGGVNNFYQLGVKENYAAGNTYSRDTHNLLLYLLTEVGLVGAVPFVGALLFALWIAWRHGLRSDDPVPFALMCALITINTSLTWIHQKVFWIVFAAAVACGVERAGSSRRAPESVPNEAE